MVQYSQHFIHQPRWGWTDMDTSDGDRISAGTNEARAGAKDPRCLMGWIWLDMAGYSGDCHRQSEAVPAGDRQGARESPG